MKRVKFSFNSLVIVAILVCVLFGACIGCNSGKVYRGNDSTRPNFEIYKVEYEGHSYLLMRFTQVNGGSMCHDENCRCRAK